MHTGNVYASSETQARFKAWWSDAREAFAISDRAEQQRRSEAITYSPNY